MGDIYEIPTGRTGDIDRAYALLRGLIGPDADPTEIFYLMHPGPPHSKARARVTRRGFAFTPKDTLEAQRMLASTYRAAIKHTFDCNVAIACVFYRQNYQIIDPDNLMKLVMDAGTKAFVWYDDSQVTSEASILELDVELPRTLIAMCAIKSTMDRRGSVTYQCARCGDDFTVQYRGTKNSRSNVRKYCTLNCGQKKAEAKCRTCGETFTRRNPGQRYCSRPCSAAGRRIRPKTKDLKPPPTCEVCGGPVSRREYVQCAKCRGKGRPSQQNGELF